MATSNKPMIVVTGPNKSGFTAWLFTAFNVYLAGGIPRRVTPAEFKGVKDFDGVIIGGGSDIHPDNFKKQPATPVHRPLKTKIKELLFFPMELVSRLTSGDYDPERDKMEQQYIDYALEYDKPILGICRGHQLINARLGGTMYTSTLPVLKENVRIRSPFPRKKVIYTKDESLIGEIAGDDPLKVNAIHSQAVAKPAEELEVTAREKSGVAQVVESAKSEKVLGVQWHPEYLFYMRAHRNIFNWLVRSAENEK
jgi:putative glutamine amidotransferase